MGNWRGQSSSEYLIMFAAVLVVGLGAVTLIGSYIGTGGQAGVAESQLYWTSSAKPISVLEAESINGTICDAGANYTGYRFVVSNADPDPIYITGLSVGNNSTAFCQEGGSSEDTSFSIGPGQKATLDFRGPPCDAGKVAEFDLTFTYDTPYAQGKSEAGSKKMSFRCGTPERVLNVPSAQNCTLGSCPSCSNQSACSSAGCSWSPASTPPCSEPACRANGALCGSGPQCCSGSCNSGVCGASGPGIGNGGSCSSDSQCSSGICSSGACASCRSDGGACSAGSECCSGNCTDSSCAANSSLVADGGACSNDTQCSSGICYAGACAPSSLANGAACSVSAQCISGLCSGGTCMASSLSNGASCVADAQCSSGICSSGLCASCRASGDVCTGGCCSGLGCNGSMCAAASSPSITTSCPLPSGTYNVAYSTTLSASGGTPPVRMEHRLFPGYSPARPVAGSECRDNQRHPVHV